MARHNGIRRWFTATLAAAALAMAMGCGKDAVKVCEKTCERVGACVGFTQGRITDCKTDCSKQAVKDLNNCKNADKFLSCEESCLDKQCNEIVRCLDGCERCVR